MNQDLYKSFQKCTVATLMNTPDFNPVHVVSPSMTTDERGMVTHHKFEIYNKLKSGKKGKQKKLTIDLYSLAHRVSFIGKQAQLAIELFPKVLQSPEISSIEPNILADLNALMEDLRKAISAISNSPQTKRVGCNCTGSDSMCMCLSCGTHTCEESIQCTECQGWYHFQCTMLSEGEIEEFSRDKNLPFSCDICSCSSQLRHEDSDTREQDAVPPLQQGPVNNSNVMCHGCLLALTEDSIECETCSNWWHKQCAYQHSRTSAPDMLSHESFTCPSCNILHYDETDSNLDKSIHVLATPDEDSDTNIRNEDISEDDSLQCSDDDDEVLFVTAQPTATNHLDGPAEPKEPAQPASQTEQTSEQAESVTEKSQNSTCTSCDHAKRTISRLNEEIKSQSSLNVILMTENENLLRNLQEARRDLRIIQGTKGNDKKLLQKKDRDISDLEATLKRQELECRNLALRNDFLCAICLHNGIETDDIESGAHARDQPNLSMHPNGCRSFTETWHPTNKQTDRNRKHSNPNHSSQSGISTQNRFTMLSEVATDHRETRLHDNPPTTSSPPRAQPKRRTSPSYFNQTYKEWHSNERGNHTSMTKPHGRNHLNRQQNNHQRQRHPQNVVSGQKTPPHPSIIDARLSTNLHTSDAMGIYNPTPATLNPQQYPTTSDKDQGNYISYANVVKPSGTSSDKEMEPQPKDVNTVMYPPSAAQRPPTIEKTSITPINTEQSPHTQPVFQHGRASTSTHRSLLESAYQLTISTLHLLALPLALSDPTLVETLKTHHHRIIYLTQSSLQLLGHSQNTSR